MPEPFTPEYRDDVQSRLVDLARYDDRIVACAVVGSGAGGLFDRWSDIDLTLAVAGTSSVSELLDDWTATLGDDFAAVRLFDVGVGLTIYRVFMLPGTLQVDLSFGPVSHFGALGPHFALVFGEAVDEPRPQGPDPAELFGMAVHHAVRARICIERSKPWQAEHWINAVREVAMHLACIPRDLEGIHAREFDGLPPDILDRARGCLVTSVDPSSLLVALGNSASFLIEVGEVFLRDNQSEASRRMIEELQGLTAWNS